MLKTNIFRATLFTSSLISALAASAATAQPRLDKIMTISELRTCMKMQQANEAVTRAIVEDQETFSRDQAAIKAEQAEVNKGNAELRTRIAVLSAESDAISKAVNDMAARAITAKTDQEKADYENDRLKLVERNRLYEQDVAKLREVQEAQLARVNRLNTRVDAINARQGPLNERVEPQQKRVADWRAQCSNRRFREEDEIVIKKELAASK